MGFLVESSAWVYFLIGGYGILWLWLVVDCLRRPAFFPVFRTARRTRIFWLLTFSLLDPFLTVLYLVFGRLASPQARSTRWRTGLVLFATVTLIINGLVPTRPSEEPVRFERDATGGFRQTTGPRFDPAGLSFHLASQFNLQFGTAQDMHFGARRPFACRRIAILCETRHPLNVRVARHVQDELTALPFVDLVDCYPSGVFAEDGGSAYDVYVTLALKALNTQDWPCYRKVKATVAYTVATSPWTRIDFEHDREAPAPWLDIRADGQCDLWGRGFRIGAKSYRLEAHQLGTSLSGVLTQALANWDQRSGTMPKLPPEFSDDYRPVKTLTGLPAGSRKIFSGSDVFEHNDSVWLAENGDSPSQIVDRFLNAGWQSERTYRDRYYRLRRGNEFLHVYSRAQAFERDRGDPAVVVHYEDRFSRQKIADVLESLQDRDAPLEILGPFESVFPWAFDARYYRRLEVRSEAEPSAADLLELASHLALDLRSHREARHALLRAFLLLMHLDLLPERDQLLSQAGQLARELGETTLRSRWNVAPALYRGLGFRELKLGETTEVTAKVGESLLFWHGWGDHDVATLALHASARPGDTRPELRAAYRFGKGRHGHGLHVKKRAAGGWSARQRLFQNRNDVPVTTQLNIESTGPDTFRVELELLPNEARVATSVRAAR